MMYLLTTLKLFSPHDEADEIALRHLNLYGIRLFFLFIEMILLKEYLSTLIKKYIC